MAVGCHFVKSVNLAALSGLTLHLHMYFGGRNTAKCAKCLCLREGGGEGCGCPLPVASRQPLWKEHLLCSSAGCDPVDKKPSLTLAGVLLYRVKILSAASMVCPSSSGSWEHGFWLWRSWLQLDPTFSPAQPHGLLRLRVRREGAVLN